MTSSNTPKQTLSLDLIESRKYRPDEQVTMPEYVASDFWAEVEKYYVAKGPYTELLQDFATREPSEKVEQQLPMPDIMDEKNGWPHQRVSKDETPSSKDLDDREAMSKILRDLEIDDSNGNPKSSKPEKSNA